MTEARLPFHRHLKWLCIEGLSPEAIQSYYDGIQLPKPTSAQIASAHNSLKTLLISPAAKRRLAKKIYSIDDQMMWKKYGFEDIYLHQTGKKFWTEIGQVLNHPVMRVALECCLVAKLHTEEISQLLPSVYALDLAPVSIALYVHYFFDYTDMNKNDWQQYLNQIAEDRYSHTRLFFALTRPQEEVLHAVGLPTRSQFGSMLKNVMNTANYRFEYYARQQSPDAQEEARKWAKLMMDAGVRHEKFGSTDATDFSKLIQTQFEYIDEPVQDVTPEMLADAKPPAQIPEAGDASRAPLPPDTLGQTRPEHDI